MSHDVCADALNMIRNAKRAGKEKVRVAIYSDLLIRVLKIMKDAGAVKSYKVNPDKSLDIVLGHVTDCKAIKPRYTVNVDQLEKYIRRYLPARGVGTVIVSSNKGLISHGEALEQRIGGCLIAYFY